MPSVLITGGSSGLGLATARALYRDGFALTLAGRRADALARAAAEFDDPARVATTVADLADPAAPDALVASHLDRFGGLDALIAAAGDYELTGIAELTAAGWDATHDVHVRGVVLCAAAAARVMRPAGHGRIVLLSSVNGLHSEPGSAAYSAAKAAVISLARTLAVDLAADGIAVNAVAPGWVLTPMTAEYLSGATSEQLHRVNPLGRAGRPEEIAAVIRFLIVGAPGFLTGSTITVDGGQTAMAPMP